LDDSVAIFIAVTCDELKKIWFSVVAIVLHGISFVFTVDHDCGSVLNLCGTTVARENHVVGRLADINVAKLDLATRKIWFFSQRLIYFRKFLTASADGIHVGDDPNILFIINYGALECLVIEVVVWRPKTVILSGLGCLLGGGKFF